VTDQAQPPTSEAPDRDTSRLEAFSDGVLAVIITIMVLGLRDPAKPTFHELGKAVPSLLVYLLSFAFIGIYWNNHHHLLRATRRISGSVMWTNLHLLFWLSLIPFLTKWVAAFHDSSLPASVYGMACLGAAIAFTILVRAIIRCNGADSEVARAVGRDLKSYLSLFLYAAGVGCAWISPWISYALYGSVSLIWFVPDRRFDRRPAADMAEGASGPL